MKRSLMMLAAVTSLLLASTAFAKEGTRDANRLAKYEAHAGAPLKDIPYSRAAAGWDVVDNSHVLLTVRPKEVYLMRINGPCLNYNRGAPAIALTSQAGRVSAGFDRITVEPRMSCRIEEIRAIDMTALREAENAKAT